MADRVTAIMAAMPLRITAATPQRTTTTATPPHTTAGTGRGTMLVPGIGALFAPHTPTTDLATIAGIAIAGDRHPEDLLVALPQVQRAASRPTAPRREERPMFGIRRREFISLIGGAATAWPLAARAQRRAKPARIGYLSSSSPPDIFLESFIRGMGVVGYGEGRDFVIEVRYAGRDYNKFPALADELLRAQVDVIVAGGPAFRTWRPGAVPVSVV